MCELCNDVTASLSWCKEDYLEKGNRKKLYLLQMLFDLETAYGEIRNQSKIVLHSEAYH